jgi:tRNA threonylcarbamoyladenosine biosynthesis protein TsaE
MKLLFEITTLCETETEAAGRSLAEHIYADGTHFTFIAMYGDLGSGKTAFVRGLASYLAPGVPVSSPTYNIINIYSGNGYILYHLDLYRITDEDDLYSVGFDELFNYNDKKVIVAAEWCENIPYALPDCHIRVTIEKNDGDSRYIKAEEIQREII